MPPSDNNGRISKPRGNANSGRRGKTPSSSRPNELSSSSIPRDSKPTKRSKHQETKESDGKNHSSRRQSRKNVSAGRGSGGKKKSNRAPPPPPSCDGGGSSAADNVSRPQSRATSRPNRQRGSPTANASSSSPVHGKSTPKKRSKSQQHSGLISSRADENDPSARDNILGKSENNLVDVSVSHRRSVESHDSTSNEFVLPDLSLAEKSLGEQHRRNAEGNGCPDLIHNATSFPPPLVRRDSSQKRHPNNTSAAAEQVDRYLKQAYCQSANTEGDTNSKKKVSPSSATSVESPPPVKSSSSVYTRSKKVASPSSASSVHSSSSAGSKHEDTKSKKKKVTRILSKLSLRSRSRDRSRSKNEIDPWSADPSESKSRFRERSLSKKQIDPWEDLADSKSRSKDRSRSKRDIDPWSVDPADGDGGNVRNLSSASKRFVAKHSQGSNDTPKTSCSTPPARPPSLRSTNMNAVVSVENSTHGASPLQPVSPGHPEKGRSSSLDFSSSSNILSSQKPPPRPPPRHTSSQAALQDRGQSNLLFNSSNTMSNTNSNVATSAIVPATDVSTNRPISNATNQPKPLRRRSRNNKNHPVSSMWYTDPYGDSGVYSGEVDDESRPHGKGKMKYDNGIFYDGNWIHGCKDEAQGNSSGDQASNVTRERILSGFTSWKGQRNKDGEPGAPGKGGFVYGMDWADYAGLSGKYTGHVDADDVPDGRGVMRYEFGLVAEGVWIKGRLNDGAGGGMSSGVVAQSVASGMSVAGGAASIVSGLGMMSIGGGGGGMMMGGYPNGMMHPQYMNAAMPMAVVHCNPAGAVMAGVPVAVNYQQQHGMMNHPAAAAAIANVPTNIVTGKNE